ncbi:MAG TPA: HD-GYP domain-containing protein [Burkholderiales bacterium]|nr:HD-GYP domain-containing protein [Burkholderiales bacterium]
MKKSVPVEELRYGMYVAELDRPWTDTPFVFQGFVLETEEELETLKSFCKWVLVDEALSEPQRQHALKPAFTPRAPRYEVQVAVDHEVERATLTHGATMSVLRDAIKAVRANQTLDAGSVAQAVDAMTQSVLRNPDALLLLSRLREKGDYAHSHSLDTAIYMACFGRFLELSVEDIALLGYLGLMQDIGKLRVPDEVLRKTERLTPAELEQARRHVQHSADILSVTPDVPPRLAELALLHHERHDGSGYPNGLKGAQIGMMGSIAAIVDTFDALTSPRPYAQAVSPSAALSMLYKWRGTFFDAALVEQFIRCIGIFPLGCVVELNSGELGIVIGQHSERRLLPRIMIVRDADGNPLKPQKLLDLSRGHRIATGEAYRIKRTLEYGKAGVSAEALFKA